MKLGLGFFGVVVAVLLTCAMIFTSGWTHPPVDTSQNGYRGLAMDQISNPEKDALLKMANAVPESMEAAAPSGQKATDVYTNVKVLTDLSVDQFNRVMVSITQWIAPQEGCAFCHNTNNLADDSHYTKIVARRMLQMTRHINMDWKQHVASVGVTCYTCHRGLEVPANVWYANPGSQHTGGFAATNHGMGHPGTENGTTALPMDPYSALFNSKDDLKSKDDIRVVATQALSTGLGASIQTTEQTYSLMIDMSQSLGVNCTFCHNTRAFSQWPESTPQRVTAWHGIEMVRELNENYLDPLKSTFPVNRLGPMGDGPKLDCATCHQGVSKPLLGVSMAKDFPELGGQSTPTSAPASAPTLTPTPTPPPAPTPPPTP